MTDAAFIEGHVGALARRDVDEVMTHYDDASRFRRGDEELVGVAAIRAHLEAQLAGAPADIHLEHDVSPDVDGWVRFDWRVLDRPGGAPVMRGYDRFLVTDGVIREQEVYVDES